MGLAERAQERDIGGVKYKMQPVPFSKGKSALLRLVKVVGPLMAAAFRGQGAQAFAAVFDALPSSLSDADLDYFEALFGDSGWYWLEDEKGARWCPLIKTNREPHFDLRYLEFMKWLLFGIEVNFSGFFGGLKSDVPKGVADLLATMQSPSTSTSGIG